MAGNLFASRLPAPEIDQQCEQALLYQPGDIRKDGQKRARFGRPEVVATLLERVQERQFSSGPEAVRAAHIAVACAKVTPPDLAGAAIRADLRGEAYALLGNTLVSTRDLPAAALWFRRAERVLARGSADPALAARVVWLRARLFRYQRQLEKAVADLWLALGLSRQAGDSGLCGKVHLSLGINFFEMGKPRRAYEEVLKALDLLDPALEPRAYFTALHEHVGHLEAVGHKAEALEISRVISPLYPVLGGTVFQLRGRFLRGRLYASQRAWGLAERDLAVVREGFLAEGMAFDAALAGLELSLVWCEQGQLDRVQSLAHHMYEVFRSQQIPREAHAALMLFANVALDNRATSALVQTTLQELYTLRRQHGEG